jgi:penicillin-binding protein 1A
MAGVGGALAGYVVYRQVAADLPDYRWLADYQPPQMSRIYAADSRLMAELAAERRVFVPIEAIPPRVAQAFVSAEDQRFREHRGVDPLGILRAVATNLEQYGSGRRMGGASTITQQVAKNMLVGADRTLARKAREAILAFRIEQALSKDRILEIYLNEIYLGSQAYGVAAAAQTYFNKGLDELTVGETAFLAACRRRRTTTTPRASPRPPAPGAIGWWTAWPRTAPFPPRRPRRQGRAGVRAAGAADGRHRGGPALHGGGAARADRPLRARQTVMGGFVVRTSLDPALQAATETALRNGLLATTAGAAGGAARWRRSRPAPPNGCRNWAGCSAPAAPRRSGASPWRWRSARAKPGSAGWSARTRAPRRSPAAACSSWRT